MTKDFLSVTEAARETGLSRTRILAIIHDGSGRLNAEKIGGVWIIPVGDVEKFIERRK
jgi:excisionase family DNA binding protein